MNNYLNKLLDELDATVFSGSTFYDPDNIVTLRHFMTRWEKELKEYESCIAIEYSKYVAEGGESN